VLPVCSPLAGSGEPEFHSGASYQDTASAGSYRAGAQRPPCCRRPERRRYAAATVNSLARRPFQRTYSQTDAQITAKGKI
jgi:hypothetical protein